MFEEDGPWNQHYSVSHFPFNHKCPLLLRSIRSKQVISTQAFSWFVSQFDKRFEFSNQILLIPKPSTSTQLSSSQYIIISSCILQSSFLKIIIALIALSPTKMDNKLKKLITWPYSSLDHLMICGSNTNWKNIKNKKTFNEIKKW